MVNFAVIYDQILMRVLLCVTTIAVLLVMLQIWKEFRQHNYIWHRRLGYVALASSALGSLSAAPYAVTYLLSAKIPETVSMMPLRI